VSLVFHSKEKRKNLKKKWRQERCKRCRVSAAAGEWRWVGVSEGETKTHREFIPETSTHTYGWMGECCFKNNFWRASELQHAVGSKKVLFQE
jgi:hypothetical protein